jgi:flagellin-like protein
LRKITKLRRSIKAISPIISVLLMIAIAVVASLVVYAWVMGYIGGTTNKTGMAINIPSFATDQATGNLIVYVQNVGQGAVQLNPAGAVYVNNNLVTINTWNGNTASGLITIAQGQTVALVVNYPYNGTQVAIKVVTTGGAFMQITGTGSSGGGATLTTTTLSSTLNSSTITLGSSVTASGSLMAGSTGVSGETVTITYSLNGETVQTDSQTTGSSGAYTDSYTPNAVGSWSVTASFAGDSTYALSSSTAQSLTVSVGALDHFIVTASGGGNIGTQTAGTAFSITITAKDSSGNTVTSYTGMNTLTASSGTISPTSTTAFVAGVWTASVTLSQAGTGISISTSGGGKSGTSNTFTVNAGALDHFVFNSLSTQTAGTAFSITITAKDANGNTVTSYVGTNTLTVSSGTISPTSTTAFVAGVWTGSVTLYTSGSGITIGTTGSSKSGTSNALTVNTGSGNFGYQTIGTSSTNGDLRNYIVGSQFTSPAYSVTAQSITAYIQVSGTHTIKAAIYTSAGTFVAGTQEVSVTTSNDGWVTFAFAAGSQPTLTANTNYLLVVWANTGTGSANLYYASSGGVGHYATQTYASTWPTSPSFTSTIVGNYDYSIYCTYSIP